MAQRASSSSSSSRFHRDYDPTALPRAWMDCPSISNTIAYRFRVFKTPLDHEYRDKIPEHKRWTCSSIIRTVQDRERNLGLVIDLTNTSRFYDPKFEFQEKRITHKKIRSSGQDDIPAADQIEEFLKICLEFIETEPESFIGIHCTLGYNRSGFMICSYLCQHLRHSVQEAVHIFAEARPPGIYKQEYLDKLQEMFGETRANSIRAPHPPHWDSQDQRSRSTSSHSNRRRNVTAKFAIDHANIFQLLDESEKDIQEKCRRLCRWERNDFPGSQPVALDLTNYQRIFLHPYRVSWKADGTRYMMYIEDENRVFMLDRNNSVFRVNGLYFPKVIPNKGHLTKTLVDGEFVIDIDRNIKIPRYLIYDMIVYDNEYVGEKSFIQRLELCQGIVNARNNAILLRLIDKSREPFSIRAKDFFQLSYVSHLLSDRFRQQITHGMDGLIFQPENEPYQTGSSPNVFKWKYDQTVDFRLEIDRTSSERKAWLFVNRVNQPYASMPYTPVLDQYDRQIIECKYQNNQWEFYRHRTDKFNPNAKATADSVMVALENHLTSEMLCLFIEEQRGFDKY